MANALYPKYKEYALSVAVNGGTQKTGTLKCSIVDSASYTYSASHQFQSDLAGVISTVSLASVTVTSGILDAADLTFTTVTAGTYEALVIWLDTAGASTTDPLVAYIDTATGLPVTSTGGNVTVTFNASGIVQT